MTCHGSGPGDNGIERLKHVTLRRRMKIRRVDSGLASAACDAVPLRSDATSAVDGQGSVRNKGDRATVRVKWVNRGPLAAPLARSRTLLRAPPLRQSQAHRRTSLPRHTTVGHGGTNVPRRETAQRVQTRRPLASNKCALPALRAPAHTQTHAPGKRKRSQAHNPKNTRNRRKRRAFRDEVRVARQPL